jgi:hypothetical protein
MREVCFDFEQHPSLVWQAGMGAGGFAARLMVEEVARVFNTTSEGVYVLTKLGLLKPLGKPPANGTKYYARSYIYRLANDEAWLAKMSDALVNYKWRKNHKNSGEAHD